VGVHTPVVELPTVGSSLYPATGLSETKQKKNWPTKDH